jgi:UDP-glucose 4-epimerase/UDP-glucuronate decarboxylase
MGFDHVVPELSMRALARENPFRVYGLEQRRAFCHVADAVEAMTRLMAAPAAEGRIVNIGNDSEETSIERLVDVVLRTAGYSPTIAALPAPSGSPARRCPDITRLRMLTGFAPKIDLESGVRQTFAWYRDRSGARRPDR